jgi:hypothetical protein
MTEAAVARHEIANLLHAYVDIADRKDVAAVVSLLGSARVRFPTDGYDHPAAAAEFFGRLWSSAVPHRHDVTNLVVHPGPTSGTWRGRAHYTRWVLEPGPELHTLGEYDLVVSESWAVQELTVTRTWTRGS